MSESPENSPLSKIVFISLPDHLQRSIGDFRVDPSRPLPVEKPENREDWNISELSWEMIIAGMLRVLAHDSNNENADYYRDFVRAARPSIIEDLTETAVLKARNRDFELAEDIFKALRGLLPDDPRTSMNLAIVYEQRADAYETIGNDELQSHYSDLAFETYKQLFAADEVLPEAHLNGGFFFLKLRSFEKARFHLESYLKLGDDPEKRREIKRIIHEIDSQNLLDTLFNEAYDFIRMGEEEKGVEKIRRFLESYPNVWNGWFLLGWGQRRLQHYAEAKRAFLKALEIGPEQADTLNELAICDMELGELAESRRRLSRALTLEPENIKIISNFGILALKEGRDAEAASFFKTVLEIEPEDPIAIRYLEKIEQ
ncbi:MAG TPA: tetratricopeptide repeat protein [Spirochaetia bacterium]|nr:tetratricopeptide repeat protein [Spirochaetia bacterium]